MNPGFLPLLSWLRKFLWDFTYLCWNLTHIRKLEEQLTDEVKQLMELAEAADNEKIPDGINLPEEIARREDRLKAIAAAKIKIGERAKERFDQEQAAYQAKLDKRAAKSQ